MKTLKTTIVLLLIGCSLYAQREFKPGFIVTLQNDTTYGFVYKLPSAEKYNKCFFSETINGEKKGYSPSNLSSYGFSEGKKYKSVKYRLNQKTEQYFSEVLISGPVSLFYRKIDNEDFYFIQKKDGFHFLSNHRHAIKLNNFDNHYLKSKQYLFALKTAFSDYPEIDKSINKTSFSRNDITTITKTYIEYKYPNKPFTVFIKTRKTSYEISPTFAYINSRMLYQTSLEAAPWQSSLGFGFNIETHPSYFHKNISMSLGVLFSDDSFSGVFENSVSGTNQIYHINLKHSTIRIPAAVRYTFPIKKIAPSVILGFGPCYMLSPKYEIKRMIINTDREYNLNVDGIRKLGFIGFMGMGATYYFSQNSAFAMNCSLERFGHVYPEKNLIDYHYKTSLITSVSYKYRF